jgi:hypothetical protein
MSSVASASISASSWEEDKYALPVAEFQVQHEDESPSDRSRFSLKTSKKMAAAERLEDSPLNGEYPCNGSVHSAFLESAHEDASHDALQTPKPKAMSESLQDSSPDGNNPDNGGIHSPFQSSQSSSRSVRFSLSSNTRHFYPHGYYGTPPGSPQQIYSESHCLDDAHHSENVVNGISIPTSDHHSTPQSLKSKDSVTRTPRSNCENSDLETATQQSTKSVNETDNAEEYETTSQSTLTRKTHTQKRKRPRSCLKATTYPSQKDRKSVV